MAPRTARRVVLRVRTPKEILERWFSSGQAGGLTVDGEPPGALGERCTLRIQVAQPERSFHIDGRLAWARHKGSRELKPSFGVELLGRPETVERLLTLVNRDFPSDLSRLDDRVSLDIRASLVHEGTTRRVLLCDLSSTGAFVETDTLLSRASSVELRFRPPRALRAIALDGKVAWVRADGPRTGLGIRFTELRRETAARLEALVERLATGAA